MIKIAITPQDYAAIVASLPPGTIAIEPQLNAKGERMIWLEERWLARLDALRQPGESYGDAILRLLGSPEG